MFYILKWPFVTACNGQTPGNAMVSYYNYLDFYLSLSINKSNIGFDINHFIEKSMIINAELRDDVIRTGDCNVEHTKYFHPGDIEMSMGLVTVQWC